MIIRAQAARSSIFAPLNRYFTRTHARKAATISPQTVVPPARAKELKRAFLQRGLIKMSPRIDIFSRENLLISKPGQTI